MVRLYPLGYLKSLFRLLRRHLPLREGFFTRTPLCDNKKEAHPKGRLRKFRKTRLTFGELKRSNLIRTFASFCAGFRLNKAIFSKVQITSFLLKKRACLHL